jgi:hypothetical protein
MSNPGDIRVDILDGFACRIGLCKARSGSFVETLSHLHIRGCVQCAQFRQSKGRQSCAQAYYDGQWNFVDVTYEGIFIRNGKVLWRDELKSNPEQV